MLLIYTASSTPRLRYILDLFFRELIGVEYRLTHSADEFVNSPLPKLNYSETPFRDELFIFSTRLLFDRGIHRQDISVFSWDDSKAFFATHPSHAFPFDPFAASFYLVTRYEEYLPFRPDALGRFEVKESLAWQKGFLQKPLINRWTKRMKELLQKRYPQLPFPDRTYQYISTIDIDNAYAFREKGIVRTAGALVRNIVKREGEALRNRIAVLLGWRKDPYDTYEDIFETERQYGFRSTWFFLLADYAENDKNVSVSSKRFQSLIKYISDYSPCGIHLSFASNTASEKITIERSRLRKVIRRNVTASRQHFLMMKFPNTCRNLLENDITDDYTMGYAGDVGFRASICSSFFFYDLEREVQTRLRIHPFAVMDATFPYYLKATPDEALNIIHSLVEEVKAVDGTFISLWHNESLSNMPPWKGWQHVFGQMVKIAAG